MTFLAVTAVIAVTVGAVHSAYLVRTDGLTRVPTRRA